jgi:hypothetical protein
MGEAMLDCLFGALDWLQRHLWRIGIRFQWPCWLIDWAWDKQATPYYPAAKQPEGSDGR